MSQETAESVLITRRELAARWHCHEDTIKRREDEGVITPVTVGHKRLYRLSDVEKAEQSAIAK